MIVIYISFYIRTFDMKNNTLRPSQFRKQAHVKIDIPEKKIVAFGREDNNENLNISKYIDKTEENKANRWLNHLHQKPLLEIMNEQIEFSQFTPVKPTQLNCYQRLKTLLSVQNGGKCNQIQSQNNAKLLKNVVIFETEINKLEQSYQSLEKSKKGIQSKNSRSYICSKSTTKHNSIFDKNSNSYTLNTTLRDCIKGTSQYRYSTKHEHPKNDLIKKSIKQEISQLKKISFSKFIHHKKEINDRTYVQLQQLLNTELQKKIQQMVNRKILQYDHIKQENSKFNTILLERQLHIEHLLKEIKLKQQKLAYQIEKQEPHQQMITLKLTVQQFYDEYHAIFGNISLVQLKKKLDYMENMCLKKYTITQGQHLDLYSRLKSENRELQEKLKENQNKYQKKQVQLNSIINRRDKYDKLDNSQEKHQIFNRIPQFRLKIAQLDKLQRFILNKYVQWLNCKSSSEANIIKLINSSSSQQNYEEMIEDMLFFNQELSPDKQTNYIGKLLSAILKLKKLVSPNKLHQKLDPLKSLQEIQTYIKTLKKPRTLNKKKTFKTKTDLVIENIDDSALNQ